MHRCVNEECLAECDRGSTQRVSCAARAVRAPVHELAGQTADACTVAHAELRPCHVGAGARVSRKKRWITPRRREAHRSRERSHERCSGRLRRAPVNPCTFAYGLQYEDEARVDTCECVDP